MIDTSRIGNEKSRKFQRELAITLGYLEQKIVRLEALHRKEIDEYEEELAKLKGKSKEEMIEIPQEPEKLYVVGFEEEEDTVENLRSQLDLLGVEYHSASKEKKLRDQLNEALKDKPNPYDPEADAPIEEREDK